ncbi:MAG: TolC family protein [Verrucomicrobiota bacterium]
MKLGWKKRPTSAPEPNHPALGSAGATVGLVGAALLFSAAPTQAALFKVGPDYQRPATATAPLYQAAELGDWKEGNPLDHVPKGEWWRLFADPTLDHLQNQALHANQDLRAAVARVDQTRATARVARSELLPSLSLDLSWSRDRFSPNQQPSFGAVTANTFRAPLDPSRNRPVGRIRRGFEGACADAQASLSDYCNILLTSKRTWPRITSPSAPSTLKSALSGAPWTCAGSKSSWCAAGSTAASAANWTWRGRKPNWP